MLKKRKEGSMGKKYEKKYKKTMANDGQLLSVLTVFRNWLVWMWAYSFPTQP